MPANELRDSDSIVNTEQLSAPVVVAGNTLSALSKADVFYRRPNHHTLEPSQREKANSYNPYWQAQLVPISRTERLTSVGLRTNGFTPTTNAGESQ